MNDENPLYDILIVSNILNTHYDKWINNPNYVDILESHSMTKYLKTQYPESTDREIYSITLSYILYLYHMTYHFISNITNIICPNNIILN